MHATGRPYPETAIYLRKHRAPQVYINVCYGTSGRVQSAAATTIASPPGPGSVPAYPAGYPKTRNGHQAPVSGILPETWVGHPSARILGP